MYYWLILESFGVMALRLRVRIAAAALSFPDAMSHARMPSSRGAASPANGMSSNGYPRPNDTTLPLSVNREPTTRPRTGDSTMSNGSYSSQTPQRPARSGLRPARGHQTNSSISSIQYRDSEEDEPASQSPQQAPRQLGNVLAAFASAGQSRQRTRQHDEPVRPPPRARDRRQNGATRPRAATGEVDDPDEWGFVMDDDFNPVELALQLLDDSFSRSKLLLERSLKSTVDKHYQAFAASLPHHSALVTSLTTSQQQITEARAKLQEAKDAFSTKRADLVQLWSRGQTVEEMIKILDEIDRLKHVPDQLESLMAEKRLLQAAILLVRSLKAINKPDMMEIGALSDLRSYMSAQETALREILIDELHSHVYLKTFWCDSRWVAYTPNQQMRVQADTVPHSLALQPNENPLDLVEGEQTLRRRPGHPHRRHRQRPEGDRNPENNSFTYIETLLESLAVLGQLASAMDVVVQRMPVEVYSLVENTIEDVSERAEFAKRSSTIGRPVNLDSLNPATSPAKDADREVLRDLFLDAVLEAGCGRAGARVIYEVANRIGSRRDFKDASGAKLTSLFSLVDIWTPLMGEIRTLLRDYITNDEALSSARNPIVSIQEILRDGRSVRNREKQMFRFTESDGKATAKLLRKHEDDLTRALKETVPGLTALMTFGSSERFNATGNQHRLIVRPEAFHVTVLFQPSLVFLGRVAEILPPGLAETARDSSTLLDDFVLTVYFPQLEERAVSGADAFQIDPTTERLSPQPLLKCTTHLMALTNSLCVMLRSTPFHRENYARLILGIVISFYQRCSERFHDLVSPDNMTNLWAQRPEVAACLSALDGVEPNSPQMARICRQETRVELNFLPGRDIRKADLIQSTRNITALGNLYHSLMWFVKQLQELKTQADDTVSPGQVHPLETPAMATPLVPAPVPARPAAPVDDTLKLPLSRGDGVTYTQLAELILYTIRIDVRFASAEPDPYILDLNTDMTACDDAVSSSLDQKQRMCVCGVVRLLLRLQQNLKNHYGRSLEAELERAKKYYSLFSLAPARLLAGIRQRAEFTLTTQSDREYNMHLIDLHALAVAMEDE
ncbi:Sec8 exocyst complex component-specific domain-containing protein [Auriculariales sp. MPI-PUGE-AT-0066]|nr:Sec8 exocyst complex component-specific domain-containing protein [Auriculariales sp. MPI-PUGE-AT-0066]